MMQIQKLFQMNFAHQTAGHRNTILTPPWPCAANVNAISYPQFLKIPGINACHLWVRICLRDLAESQSERIALYAGISCGWSIFVYIYIYYITCIFRRSYLLWVYQRLTFDFVFLLGIDVWHGWTCSIMINLLVELWNRSSHTLDQLLFLARCCETRRSTRLHGEQCLAQISTTTNLPQSYCLERSECHDHVPMAWNIHGKNGTFPRKLVEWLDLMNTFSAILLLFWSDLIQSVLSNLISSNLRGRRDLRSRTGPWEPRASYASGSCHVWGTSKKGFCAGRNGSAGNGRSWK